MVRNTDNIFYMDANSGGKDTRHDKDNEPNDNWF